jgi:putative oxidoreductase
VDQPNKQAAIGLLVLRLTLGYFLLLWSLEKLLVPRASIGIAKAFYGVQLPVWGSHALGIAEMILALALLFGAWRTVTYALALAVHTITVLVSWRRMFDPMALIGANHLWISTWPTWGGFVALFLMRGWDAYSVDGWRRTRR